MKLSDIRKIIREEIKSQIRQNLNEVFQDPLARELASVISKYDKDGKMSNRSKLYNTKYVFNALAKKYDIAWDTVPVGTVQKLTNPSDKAAKKGISFWVVTQDKKNPYEKDSYYAKQGIGRGVLAISIDDKVQYWTGTDALGPKADRSPRAVGYRDAGAPGKSIPGTLMIKKLQDLADVVYNISPEQLDQISGGTTDLKKARVELKVGKDIFRDPKAWKKANLARYQNILANRANKKTEIDRMIAEMMKASNDAVMSITTNPVWHGDTLYVEFMGQEVQPTDITNALNNAMREYQRYMRYSKEGEEQDSNYYRKSAKDAALDIKKMHAKMMAGNIGW